MSEFLSNIWRKKVSLLGMLILLGGLSAAWLDVFYQLTVQENEYPAPQIQSQIDNLDSFSTPSLDLPMRYLNEEYYLSKLKSTSFPPGLVLTKIFISPPNLDISPPEKLIIAGPISKQLIWLAKSAADLRTKLAEVENNNSQISTSQSSVLRASYREDPKITQFAINSGHTAFLANGLLMESPNQTGLTMKTATNFAAANSVKSNKKANIMRPKLRPKDLNSGIYIAIGFYARPESLQNASEALSLTGYPFRSQRRKLRGTDGNFVTAGPFSTKNNANAALDILKIMGFSDAYVIK
jgi:hypothetical protein